ncbi:hypothetical protein LAZ67_2003687 [Cordylochernes scorpioides]|uniref:Uncharacterized protein n=1 Tax=Cordylochernes scorpioides TaxID=51811 RepID=A0ABY6K345_9ARAC|nr:hypothetical protein LAZ67_2003687 [Cordylochernes scorpioides]
MAAGFEGRRKPKEFIKRLHKITRSGCWLPLPYYGVGPLEESFAGDERYLPSSDPQVLDWLKSKIEMVQLVNMEHKPCPATG